MPACPAEDLRVPACPAEDLPVKARPVLVRSQREGISGPVVVVVVAMAPERCCIQEQETSTQIRRAAIGKCAPHH